MSDNYRERAVIPGFVERDRPDPPLRDLTLAQLRADLRRLDDRRATPAMRERAREIEAEIERRGES